MDRFEAMAMLIEATERGSLSAASRSQRIPLATVSRKISALEARLGVKLLVRTTRRLVLTDAGVAYLAAARRIVEQVNEAEREAVGELVVPKGELAIGAPVLLGRLHVLPIISEFLTLHPDIDVRLLLSDRNADLVDGQVDMAVRIGALPDGAMIATRVGSMRTVTCASPRLLRRHGLPEVPVDLAGFPCIGVDMPAPSPGWAFASPGSTQPVGIAVRCRLSVTTAEAAAKAAEDDVGVARLLHYQVADAVDGGSLRIVLERYEPAPAPVHLVHAARGRMPLKLRRFLDHAAPRLRERLVRFGAAATR